MISLGEDFILYKVRKMFTPVHPVYHALGRVHSQLHPRNVRIVGRNSSSLWIAECVCKDDGPLSHGIPDIPCQFVFSDHEDWDQFVVGFWRVLEDEKKRLGF
jgi:hypothetical protein